ncbi:MAG: NAD(P)H-hydrate dehydratase [Chloroflexota bacterium]
MDAQKSGENGKGRLLTEEMVRGLLPDRPDYSNKGTFGKAFVVAGSINYVGAAALATQGAMRVGTGLVTLACPGDLLLMLAAKLTECTFLPLPSDLGAIGSHASEKLRTEMGDYQALLVGCGLGKDKETGTFLRSLFTKPDRLAHAAQRAIGFAAMRAKEEEAKEEDSALPPLVLDGDALNLLAEWPEWATVVPEGSVLTPHPGEMSRLLGSSVEEVQKERVSVASEAAAKWRMVVVLKGAGTVIASPDGRVFLSPFSNPALATAGTGDVLAGAITGLVAQGLSPLDAACAGVYLHGVAGEMLRDEYGVAGGLAGDLPVLLAKAQRRVRMGGKR